MFSRLVILALLLMPSVASAAQDPAPVGLLRADDYPAEAIRLGQQGTVRVRLKVSAEGRVMACSIIQSASPSLDRTTCRILSERARFRPATGTNGVAIESEFEAPPIHWVLPGKPAPSQGLRL
ncbi:MAG: energy transducer TonB [Sphingomicrobium sp.]